MEAEEDIVGVHRVDAVGVPLQELLLTGDKLTSIKGLLAPPSVHSVILSWVDFGVFDFNSFKSEVSDFLQFLDQELT